MAGSGRYKHTVPTDSPLSRIWRVFLHSVSRRNNTNNNNNQNDNTTRPALTTTTTPTTTTTNTRLFPAGGNPNPAGGQTLTPAPSARDVAEVRQVVRLLPIFGTMIMFWAVYAQMSSLFVIQGEQMDRRVGGGGEGGGIRLPAASLSAVNTVAIIGLIPIYDRVRTRSLADYTYNTNPKPC